jgi:transglutaminase-like putative cysteine protease
LAKSQKVFFRKALGLWFALSLVMAFLAQHQWFAQRAYLQGFAEAIAPLDGSPSEKVDALLRYFRHHPPRLKTDPNDGDKNPVTALRSSELFKICGSASAAFVFLARSLGIPARVLLLLNERGVTKHVTAEVWLDGRWVVVEPTFGLAMKDGNGRWLSKEDLRDLATLRQATRHVAYPPDYTYDRTGYINWRKVPLVGQRLGDWLRKRGWEERIGRPSVLDNSVLARLYFWLISAAFSGGWLLWQHLKERRKNKGA